MNDAGCDFKQSERVLELAHIVDFGTVIAFRVSGYVLSGKVVERDSDSEWLKVETKNGTVFEVPYYDVVWVKLGDRWPSWVFKLLKGEEHGGG